jgi:hypothetical protein
MCDVYFPDLEKGAIRRRSPRPSPVMNSEELGWFSDIDQFKLICMAQPVEPVPKKNPEYNATFNAWKTALVLELDANHQKLWTKNKAVDYSTA